MKIRCKYIQKSILMLLLILAAMIDAGAQFKATGSTTDIQVNREYGKLITKNGLMTANTQLNEEALEGVQKVVEDELKQLISYNIRYVEKGSQINQFIRSISYDFIEEKYPIYKPDGTTEFAKNSLIRGRFKFKLESESRMANSYLALDNAISEGFRIFLLLSSLEKVITICIEDEDY